MIPKFRAWNIESQCMLNHGFIVNTVIQNGEIVRDFSDILEHNDMFILMQSTGLKDKNGKEIFEGDVVKVSQDDDYFISFVKNMIEFDCPGFDVPFPDDWNYECNVLSHLMNTDQTIEVIGNIHEHPELLNQPNE